MTGGRRSILLGMVCGSGGRSSSFASIPRARRFRRRNSLLFYGGLQTINSAAPARGTGGGACSHLASICGGLCVVVVPMPAARLRLADPRNGIGFAVNLRRGRDPPCSA